MKPFLIAYAVFVLGVSPLLVIYPKEELFVLLNGAYCSIGDAVFPYITYLGGGLLSVLVVILFLFIQYRLTIIASVSFLLTGLITQFLKHTFFSECVRPLKFFDGSEIVHTVVGVDMYFQNSFPSGHSATAFSLFLMLALALKRKYQVFGILFFMLALIGGYSRIYLGQHFPEDVLAGSFIGVTITILCYLILNKQLATRAWASKRLEKKGVNS